jgi:hypothetical protein
MRASSIQFSSLVVVALALTSGCASDDAPQAVEAQAPSTRVRTPGPVPDLPPRLSPVAPRGQRQSQPTAAPEPELSRMGRRLDDLVPQAARGLVFQCTDNVRFAVRMQSGGKLEVFPPGFTLGYIVLTQQPTDSGVLYSRRGAEFRTDGEVGTLLLGDDERYVDCVSNPAAAVWEPSTPAGAARR